MPPSVNANNLTPPFYQRRKEIRRELFIQRQADRDNTEARLFNDSKKIDAQLIAEGYKFPYPTEWARARSEKHLNNKARPLLQVDVVDLFNKVGV
jgi:hypothetical protein